MLIFIAFGAVGAGLGYRALRSEKFGNLLVERRIPGWVRNRERAEDRYRKLVGALLLVVGTGFVVAGIAVLVSAASEEKYRPRKAGSGMRPGPLNLARLAVTGQS
jgi:hypothetical protein